MPSDHRYYTDADVDRFLGVERTPAFRQTVVYCRVSRRAQRDDLWLQQQAMETFCLEAGLPVDEWLTEVAA